MKKFASLVLALSLILSLAGCSESKPDTAVTSFCNALKAYDFDTASSYMEDCDDFSDPYKEDEIEGDIASEQFFSYLKENTGKMTYSLQEAQIDGDTATVPVSFTYVDASAVVTAALGEYLTQAFALALGGADDEQMEELFGNILVEKTASMEPGTTTDDINFTCVKVDGTWKIAKFSDNDAEMLNNILTCNIANALDDFDDSSDASTPDEESDQTVWHDVPFGQETELATIKIKITGCEEKQELTGEYVKSDVAQEGTKFIVLNVAIENITKASINFDNSLPLTDHEGRSYNAYDNALWYYDETFSYTNLAPNIVKEGVFVYNVPSDSSDYFLSVLKDGTDDGYRLYSK